MRYIEATYGVYLELYPNTNSEGIQKFKVDGVTWNLLILETGNYVKHNTVIHNNNPDIDRLRNFMLEGLPFEAVVVYEYKENEDRV